MRTGTGFTPSKVTAAKATAAKPGHATRMRTPGLPGAGDPSEQRSVPVPQADDADREQCADPELPDAGERAEVGTRRPDGGGVDRVAE